MNKKENRQRPKSDPDSVEFSDRLLTNLADVKKIDHNMEIFHQRIRIYFLKEGKSSTKAKKV